MASKSATRCLSKALSRPTINSSTATRTQRLAAATTDA